MELIVKPTSRCNFNCSFCSANLLKIKHNSSVPQELKDIIKILSPDNIIFVGGDPLLVEPSYYEEILALGDFEVSLTTNLKNFYLNPDKWKELFRNPRVDICTSFHYGTNRKWDKNTPYTESMFINVMNKFYDEIGYMPCFISIISDENEADALKHLELAKKLNGCCKLNRLLPLGLSKDFYPLYKMIDIWIKVYESDLLDYWDNDNQFYQGGCNFNTSLLCESSIRSFWISENNKVVYSNCEDCATYGHEIPIDKVRPIQKEVPIPISDIIKQDCLCCPLFRLCNGCKLSRMTNKITPNHCEEMLKRLPKIKELGWKI